MIYITGDITTEECSEYLELLTGSSEILLDKDKLLSDISYQSQINDTLARYLSSVIYMDSGGMITSITKDAIINYLIDYKNVPEANFLTHKGSYTLDITDIVGPLIERGVALGFLPFFSEYRSRESAINNMRSLYKRHSHNVSDGLLHIPFTVAEQASQRFYYSHENIVGMPLLFSNSIVAPPGKFLVSGDIGQADFRIAYSTLIRDDKNWEIMKKYPDAYEGILRCLAEEFSENFDHEEFVKERSSNKVDVLAVTYGTRGSKEPKRDKFIKRFYGFLRRCERYDMLEKQIVAQIAVGLPLRVNAYFGSEQTIAYAPHEGTRAKNKALNFPVQNTTSQIIIKSVILILKFFREQGFGKDDIDVYFVRHDEPIFVCSDKMRPHVGLFQMVRDLVIDDWIPLSFDFKFGRYYLEPEEELAEIYLKAEGKRQENANEDLREKGKKCSDFFPMVKCAILYVDHVYNNGEYVVTIYDACDNRAVSFVVGEDSLTAEIKEVVYKLSPTWIDRGYRNVCVYWNHLDCWEPRKINDRQEVFAFKNIGKSMQNLASGIAEFRARAYFRKNEINYVERDIIGPSQRDFIDKVKPWEIPV